MAQVGIRINEESKQEMINYCLENGFKYPDVLRLSLSLGFAELKEKISKADTTTKLLILKGMV